MTSSAHPVGVCLVCTFPQANGAGKSTCVDAKELMVTPPRKGLLASPHPFACSSSSGALGRHAACVQAQALASVQRIDDSDVVGDWCLEVGQAIFNVHLCSQIIARSPLARVGCGLVSDGTHPADRDETRRLTLRARLGVGRVTFCSDTSAVNTESATRRKSARACCQRAE